MPSYEIEIIKGIKDQDISACYEKAKSIDPDFSYEDLDIIFSIALDSKSLFPKLNLSGSFSTAAFIERWVSNYRNAIINPPHTHIAKPKITCSDPAVKRIVMMTQGITEADADAEELSHNLFMSAENIQGNLLEEYIATSTRPYGWIWCTGKTLRSIDLCSSDGKVLLQIKNKSNTENSSSSQIRQGTSIEKWYRLGTRTIKGKRYPTYKWDILNEIVNGHQTAGFDLKPCSMSEDHYIQFISDWAKCNPDMITSE